MIFEDEAERRPEVLCGRNFLIAIALHVVMFLFFYGVSKINLKPKETVIPIELLFEAPPEEVAPDEPEPEPEPPKPEPKVETPPPPPEEHLDAVVKVKEEKKPEKKPEPPKEKPKPPEPKPEKPKEKPKPKKTKEQLKKERAERLRKMREGAKVVKNPKPTPVAGTGQKLDPNWEKLLKAGYKPSNRTQLAANEQQLCYSLIKTAFHDRWERPPWTDTLRPMVLRVYFGPGGRVVSFKLENGSGDAKADATVMAAARAVRVVPGLTAAFVDSVKSAGVPIEFKVTPQ